MLEMLDFQKIPIIFFKYFVEAIQIYIIQAWEPSVAQGTSTYHVYPRLVTNFPYKFRI